MAKEIEVRGQKDKDGNVFMNVDDTVLYFQEMKKSGGSVSCDSVIEWLLKYKLDALYL